MPVDFPSWFKADWPANSKAGAEMWSEYFEDIRKFIACGTIGGAGKMNLDEYFPDYDITQWNTYWAAAATSAPDARNYSGIVYRWYGELYILVVRNWYKTNTEMVTLYPTTESDKGSIAPIVSHEDAVINSNWKLWPNANLYSHWNHNSGKWDVRHHGIISDVTEEPSWNFYDCILPAHRFLPFDTKAASHPPAGAEIKRDHHTQKLNTCWNRCLPSWDGLSVYFPTEITVEQPEPYDPDVSAQLFHAPYFGDETTLECMAFQNAIAFWSDLGGWGWLKKISSDEVYQEWWARRNSGPITMYAVYPKGAICYASGGAPTGDKYACVKAHYNTTNDLGNTTYWSPDFYQPTRFSNQPIWTHYADDWLGCNASGFEAMLADFGTYDWYWCSVADGNHPAWLDWFAHMVDDEYAPSEGAPAPRGCWRRMFRYTFGKPKKSNGDEIEDWKIWPGTEGDPPGYNETKARQLMVTAAEYALIPTGQWMYTIAPTDAAIQAAWNALDDQVKADCIARHGPVDIDYGVTPNKPVYEMHHEMINDLWGVLRYWQYFDVSDWLTITPKVLCYAYQEHFALDYNFTSPSQLQSDVGAFRNLPWMCTPWESGKYYSGYKLVSAPCPSQANVGGFNEFVYNGKANFQLAAAHTSGSSFLADYLAGKWSKFPVLPEFGEEATHKGVTHYVNPSITVYGVDGDWCKCGYSFGFTYWDDPPRWSATLGEYTSPRTSFPRMTRAAANVRLAVWDDPYDRSMRLTAAKNLKLRCWYRPVRVPYPPYADYTGCKIEIDGGYATTTPCDTEEEQDEATRNAYFNFNPGQEDKGEYNALVTVGIVSDWPFDRVSDWITGGSLYKRWTEVNMNLSTDYSRAIAEIDWDKFADFVNA